MKLEFSKNIYSIDALLGAAYVFTDVAYIHLDENEVSYLVDLESKIIDIPISESIIGEFKNELLAQLLRKRINDRTSAIRNLIYQRAMSSSLIINNPDYIEMSENSLSDYNLDDILKDWFNDSN